MGIKVGNRKISHFHFVALYMGYIWWKPGIFLLCNGASIMQDAAAE